MTSGGATRSSIIDAARAEFAEQGFAGARMARIAARAGVNKQLLHYYFGNKAGLHVAAAAADERPTETRDQAAAGSPPDRLRRALRALQVELEGRPDLAVLLVDPKAGAGAAALAREYADRRLASLARIFSDGQGQGYFRDDLDPAVCARQALVLVAGVRTLPHPSSSTPAQREEWSVAAADLLLRAATW
jgi:TetR/AcrR family transcriptional regulator